MKLTLTPMVTMVLFLVLLSLGASYSYAEIDVTLWGIQFFHLALLFGSSLLTFFVIRFLKPEAKLTINHRLITTLILFLLFDPVYSWWAFILLGIFTELGERLIRTVFGPLFNPAALGILILSFFGFSSTWWGTSFAPRFPLLDIDISIAILLILPLAGYVAYRYKKLKIILAALVGFIVSSLVFTQALPLYSLLEGTLLFFLLVMVVEPKTSPNTPKEQYLYGALVGILIPLYTYFSVGEAFIAALLIANVYTRRNFILDLLSKKETLTKN